MQAIGTLPYNVEEDAVISARNRLKAQLLFSQETPLGAAPLYHASGPSRLVPMPLHNSHLPLLRTQNC